MKHDVKARKKDRELETQFERDIRCLGKLAWKCLLNDRHSFFEEELEELEKRNEKLVIRGLGFDYKEESLKSVKPQHEYCFLHKSFQEFLAASYVAHKLRRNEFNVFEHLNFDDVVENFPQVFVFVCGILREEASILFAQIGEKLKSDWDWLKCSEAAANFFIESWSESGNAEEMAITLCSFIPFPRVVHLFCHRNYIDEWNLVRVLLFCRRFSKVEAPDEIRVGAFFSRSPYCHFSVVKDLLSLSNVKSLHFSGRDMGVESAHRIFQILPDFASLTELVLPDVLKMTDWGIVADTLTTSKTLERVGCVFFGERGEGWARALDAGLCADTPLSSVDLTICGPMSETALQAFDNLLLNKSLSSVSVTVKGDMSHSLAVTLSRALAGETAVKSLNLCIFGKLSFCCSNLVERGIVKNNTLSNLVVSLCGELPDNWQVIVENLKVQLAEKSTVTFQIYPNTLNPVTATHLTDFRPCVIKYGFFERKSVTLNVWGELTVDSAEALYNLLPFTWVCHLTLNIHGKLTDDFLHWTARRAYNQKPLLPITINTWDQLTNEGKALFKELELDKNPAVTLNVCEVHLSSDELDDDDIVFIDNPESLITLLEEAEKTGKENLTVTIDVQSGDPTCYHSDDSTGRSWSDSLLHGLPRNYSLHSLTLTINHFSPKSSELAFTMFCYLESCISLKSLNLTLNEYNKKWTNTFEYLQKGLGRNTSLIYLTLTVNIYSLGCYLRDLGFYDDVVPKISLNSLSLTINDVNGFWYLPRGDLWSNFKSINTLNLTFNNWDEVSVDRLLESLDKVMKVDSLRTLRVKINELRFRRIFFHPEYDFNKLVVKSPSLELIELTICRYGVVGSWLETLKWEKQ